MNRRLISCIVLGLGLGLAGHAYGQSIPPALKTSTTLSADNRATIAAFVKAQVAKLTGTDSAGQSAARELLCGEGSSPSATTTYADAYAQAVAEALLPLADDPSVRVRLSVGIISARVADRCNSSRFTAVALKLIKDKAEPVELWGLKAAKATLGAQMRQQALMNDPLLLALVPAVQRNLTGPLTQEAYEALRLNITNDRNGVTDAMIKAVVPEMQKLLQLRLAAYGQGVPSDPQTDTMATSFLIDTKVWAAQSREQKTTTAQSLVDLLYAASRRTADFEAKDKPEARPHKDELVQTLKLVGSGLRVVGDNESSAVLSSAAVPLTKLDVSIDSGTISKFADEAIAAVVAIPSLKGVKTPTTMPVAK